MSAGLSRSIGLAPTKTWRFTQASPSRSATRRTRVARDAPGPVLAGAEGLVPQHPIGLDARREVGRGAGRHRPCGGGGLAGLPPRVLASGRQRAGARLVGAVAHRSDPSQLVVRGRVHRLGTFRWQHRNSGHRGLGPMRVARVRRTCSRARNRRRHDGHRRRAWAPMRRAPRYDPRRALPCGVRPAPARRPPAPRRPTGRRRPDRRDPRCRQPPVRPVRRGGHDDVAHRVGRGPQAVVALLLLPPQGGDRRRARGAGQRGPARRHAEDRGRRRLARRAAAPVRPGRHGRPLRAAVRHQRGAPHRRPRHRPVRRRTGRSGPRSSG